MVLTKSQTLYLRSGRTDNVYQIEMLEVGPASYVVNFRYGRRGTYLKEGTRTTLPVDRAKAERIYGDLVAAQENKGYRRELSPADEADKAANAGPSRDTPPNPMHRAILARLEAGLASGSEWKLSRAVWRAGEIGLSDAEPLLPKLLENADGMLAYSIVWALGRLGSRDAMARMRALLADTHAPNRIRRMARAAIFTISTDEERAKESRQTLALLPASVRQGAESGDGNALQEALDALLREKSPEGFAAIEHLYYSELPACRDTLLRTLDAVPMEAGYFQPVKHLFKVAEMRRDGVVYGRIARRFETSPPASSGSNYARRDTGRATRAFGSVTRQYLIKRVWRTLRRLGDLGHPDYTKMASGVLLAYSDEDAHPPQVRPRFIWERGRGYRQVDVHFDIYSQYYVLGHILFRHSPRYDFDRERFVCVPPYQPGGAPPDVREEAYPELWTADPDALLGLLKNSRLAAVHHFAEKAIRQCEAFLETVDGADVAELLRSPYDKTARLGFDLALAGYDSSAPNLAVIAAAADCRIDAARESARTWIERHLPAFLKESDLLLSLIASGYADTRSHIAAQLERALLSDTDAKALVGRLFALLMSLPEDEDERAGHIAAAMMQSFSKHLTEVDEALLDDLMASPLTALHRLAGELVIISRRFADNPPPKMLSALLGSPDSNVREIGVRLMGKLPEHLLVSNRSALLGITCHEMKDIRDAVRPIVKRVARNNTMFARQLVEEMIDALLTPKMPKGVPSHLLVVLREDFGDRLSGLPESTVWRLLRARSPVAQELGGVLLAANIDPKTLTMAQIVTLGNHEILSIREAAWQACRADMGRVRSELSEAVRLLDARFEDTRRIAMPIIKDALGAMAPDPDILVSLCDSVRPEVQQFAREMITRYFESELGETYLRKLSEHPSADLQLFATNYLESYASDNLEILSGLMPYFQTVLSQVNRARVAKDRVLRFLGNEAGKNRDAAALVAGLLARQSVTVAIGDKATLIEAMMAIKRTYPDIEVPLVIRETQVRRGV